MIALLVVRVIPSLCMVCCLHLRAISTTELRTVSGIIIFSVVIFVTVC